MKSSLALTHIHVSRTLFDLGRTSLDSSGLSIFAPTLSRRGELAVEYLALFRIYSGHAV